jgi:serine/threonine protein kinase
MLCFVLVLTALSSFVVVVFLRTCLCPGDFDFPAPYWSNISAAAKDLVKKLLTVNPDQRATAKQVLEHPWISGNQASTAPLGADYNKRLLMLQARRRLKKGVQIVIAANKLSMMVEAIMREEAARGGAGSAAGAPAAL